MARPTSSSSRARRTWSPSRTAASSTCCLSMRSYSARVSRCFCSVPALRPSVGGSGGFTVDRLARLPLAECALSRQAAGTPLRCVLAIPSQQATGTPLSVSHICM
eukprot:3255348-Prymnesium_polylepis.1